MAWFVRSPSTPPATLPTCCSTNRGIRLTPKSQTPATSLPAVNAYAGPLPAASCATVEAPLEDCFGPSGPTKHSLHSPKGFDVGLTSLAVLLMSSLVSLAVLPTSIAAAPLLAIMFCALGGPPALPAFLVEACESFRGSFHRFHGSFHDFHGSFHASMPWKLP